MGIQKHCFKLIDNVAQEFDQLFTRSGILNFCAVAMSLHDMGYRPLVSNCLSKWHLLVSFAKNLTFDQGVRIDSGDLAYLSCIVKEQFDRVRQQRSCIK